VQIRKAPFSSYAVWLGGLLAVAGLVVLLGYGAYYFTTSFFGSTGVPLGVQFAVAALVCWDPGDNSGSDHRPTTPASC